MKYAACLPYQISDSTVLIRLRAILEQRAYITTFDLGPIVHPLPTSSFDISLSHVNPSPHPLMQILPFSDIECLDPIRRPSSEASTYYYEDPYSRFLASIPPMVRADGTEVYFHGVREGGVVGIYDVW